MAGSQLGGLGGLVARLSRLLLFLKCPFVEFSPWWENFLTVVKKLSHRGEISFMSANIIFFWAL